MKNIIIAVAAIFIASGCHPDPVYVEESFTASIEPLTNTVDGFSGKISWAAGDRIVINEEVFTTETAGARVTFTNNTLNKLTDIPYMAYYPAANGASIPATYSYDDGVSYLPLYASGSDHHLQFRNVCGVIGIRVTKDETEVVKKIRVSCTDKAMCGKYSINNDNEAKLITETSMDGSNSVVLDCGSGKTISDSETMFYIPVPPGDYKNIKIELSSDGTNYENVMYARQGSVNIPVNTIWTFLPMGSYPLSPEPTVDKMM